MKRLFTAILLIFISTGFLFSTPVGDHGNLTVSGRYMKDKNNANMNLRGQSFGWSTWWPQYWNANVVSWLATDWKVDIVRASMGVDVTPGYLNDATNQKNLLKAVVDGAIASGIYVIIDWHCEAFHQAEAVAFFKEMAQTYGNNPNVIYEILNEPTTQTWAEVKTYAAAVIAGIRQYDPDNIIVVGCPQWDQLINQVADAPLTGYTNIMYTVHFYAATHGQWLRDQCSYAIGKNLPIFVTECSGMEASGSGAINYTEWEAWFTFMENNSISWCNWSISDAAGQSCSVLLPGAPSNGGWTSAQMNESGNYIRTKIRSFASTTVPVTGVSLSPTTASIAVNGTKQLTATVAPSNATNKTVTWSSNNTAIATVSTSGLVTGKAAGTCTITVTTQDGGKTATCAITVTSGTATALPGTVQAENYSAMSGIQTEACTDAGGGLNVGYIESGDWMDYLVNPSSSGTYTVNLRVASTGTTGICQIKKGTTVLATVNIPNTGGWQTWTTVSSSVSLTSGSQTIRLQATGTGWNINWWSAATGVPVTGVTVSPTSASIAVNGTRQLTATVAPSNATNKTVTWSSNNTAIATVSSSGLVTGKAAGTCTITVTTQDGGKTATCAITVTAAVTNLLANPGWESGTTSWTIENPPFSVSTADKRSGTQSLKLAGTGSWKNTYQTVNVTANTNYTLKAYIKGTAQVYFGIYTATWSASIASQNNTPTSSWVQYSKTFNSGSNTQIIIDFQDASSGTSYIDDASLTVGTSKSLLKKTAIETENPEQIAIYPNPAIDKVNFIFNSIGSNTVRIYDINGKLIFNETFTERQITINPSSKFGKGVYIVKISNSESGYIKKLIVN